VEVILMIYGIKCFPQADFVIKYNDGAI
jgi:hypothetical protein